MEARRHGDGVQGAPGLKGRDTQLRPDPVRHLLKGVGQGLDPRLHVGGKEILQGGVQLAEAFRKGLRHPVVQHGKLVHRELQDPGIVKDHPSRPNLVQVPGQGLPVQGHQHVHLSSEGRHGFSREAHIQVGVPPHDVGVVLPLGGHPPAPLGHRPGEKGGRRLYPAPLGAAHAPGEVFHKPSFAL